VIYVPVSVQPSSGFHVRRVNIERHVLIRQVLVHKGESITGKETHAANIHANFANSPGQCFGIPTGIDSPVILSSFYQSGPWSHDPSTLNPVSKQSKKSPTTQGWGGSVRFFCKRQSDICFCQLE